MQEGVQFVGSSLVQTFGHDIVEPQRKTIARESYCNVTITFLDPFCTIGSAPLSEGNVSPQKGT